MVGYQENKQKNKKQEGIKNFANDSILKNFMERAVLKMGEDTGKIICIFHKLFSYMKIIFISIRFRLEVIRERMGRYRDNV